MEIFLTMEAENNANKARASFRFTIKNLGCKCNRYEADALALFLAEQGGEEVTEEQACDLALLNTCTVTAEAGRKSCQALRRLRREHPAAVIGVMGCHSQLEDLSDLCDFQTGVEGRLGLAEACLKELQQRRRMGQPSVEPERAAHPQEPGAALPSEIGGTEASETAVAVRAGQNWRPCAHDSAYEELGTVREQTETRAQIKICDGCNQFCTYCAICLARGRVRSRGRSEILEEARALTAAGHKEIVLTATHLCSFEKEQGHDILALAELLEELDQTPGLERLRLGSLEPASLTPAFISRVSRLRTLCPHFHLSLQSGSDTVLARMHRQYSSEDYRRVVQTLRQAFDDPAITTDIMVAFPEESEAEFAESFHFAEEIGFARIHVFRYSPRKGTAAARMKQVPAAISKARGEAMQKLAGKLAETYAASRVGEEDSFVAEQPLGEGAFNGVTSRYDPAVLQRRKDGSVPHRGDFVHCRVLRAEGERLILEEI